MAAFENANPAVFLTMVATRSHAVGDDEVDEDGARPVRVSVLTAAQVRDAAAAPSLRRVAREGVDALEVFELIRHLNDPEHPLTLEALNVASLDLIAVDDAGSTVDVHFTPTIPCAGGRVGGRARERSCRPRALLATTRARAGTHERVAAGRARC
jgi:hypothetical protein